MPDYNTYRQIFHDCPMPFAFVDLDLFDENIRALTDRAAGKQIRIASKSLRCLTLIERVLQAHDSMTGIMCFSPDEMVALSQAGQDELLMGYPCWHPKHIRAIAAEVKKGKQLTLMVDSVEHVEHLAAIASSEDVILSLCLDIDMSVDFPGLHFGVWRSGITNKEKALTVYQAIAKSPHLRLDGVMGYEAQIAGVGDKVPNSGPKNHLLRFLKKRSIPQIAARRAAIVQALQDAGASLRFVNGGGTGSIETTCAEAAVTEVTIGSGFYSPTLFDHYQAFKHHPAAGYAIEIVRQPKPDTYTCLGGGYIASGGIGKDKEPAIYLPDGATLNGLEGAGEVQTPVIYNGNIPLSMGDPIFMRHSKAGELCERFNQLYLISKGGIVDEVPTYRGQGWCFL
ncbi:MAG: amino acid deaminase/aldolase [Chloroflexota bacterium]